MNYLAHFQLSAGKDDWLLGGLLGDFVKGPLRGELPTGIEQGVILHRQIDAFTDRHPELRTLHQQFDPRFRRYAGIMTDVLFDHLLNLHWQRFHPQPLASFSRGVYQLLSSSDQLLPAAQRQADNLVQYDVLQNFKHWQTVEGALSRIGERLPRANPLAEAAAELSQHYDALEAGFLRFYPQLQAHADTVRRGFAEQER